MIPLKGVPEWTPVQQHAAKAFLSEEENDVVAYQMEPGSGKTTLLLGLIALYRFVEKTKKRIILLVHSSMLHDWIHNQLNGMTGVATDGKFSVVSIENALDLYSMENYEWILIDGCKGLPDSNFFARLLPTLRHNKQRVLFLYSDETPAHLKKRYIYSKQTIATLYKTDYPNATRQAIYAFAICAQRLGMYRDVIILICKWIERTRRDVSWLDLEYP